MAKDCKYKTIEELQKRRTSWVADSKEQGMYDGFRAYLTKLYTSSGHFIFELLQNAEDVYATTVTFRLESDKLIFEHNGTRKFDMNDINSITNIGNSTKEKDNGNSIGKFGIGFKSVFEYTNTPEIHSVDYHFCIEELFIPKVIPSINDYDKSKTLIILPFNGPKNTSDCYSEIKESFEALRATVLLFLRNIIEINCIYENRKITITREDSYKDNSCPENVCRLQRIISNNGEVEKEKNALFYKRFFKQITVLNENNELQNITIAIAFKMLCSKDDNKWKITPILKKNTTIPAGKIFAYFPCEKEEKKFCFHIHAPFALTIDREKLRDDAANTKVIEEIGTLLCESMKELKQEKLINLDLYKTLPNEKDDDDLGKYLIIRSKVQNLFLNNPYVLMADDSYQDPRNKYMGSRQLQELISDQDLSILNNSNQKSFWIKNPNQKNQRDYNFLKSLKIYDYTSADFLNSYVNLLNDKEDEFILFKKSLEERGAKWFAKLYSIMHTNWSYISDLPFFNDKNSIPLCFCDDNKIYPFNECYLSNSIFENNEYPIHCVNKDCFDKKFTDADNRYFLNRYFDIQEFGLSDLVTAICSKFNKKDDKKIEDIKIFFDLYKQDKSIIETLKEYRILMSETGKWALPKNFYIPEEILNDVSFMIDTVKNISIYFDFYNTKVQGPVYKLNPEYKNLFDDEKELDNFYIFLVKLGCKDNIPVYHSDCWENPNWDEIADNFESSTFNAGNRNKTNFDYKILYFDEFLNRPVNEAVFELIISSLINYGNNFIKCVYTPAQKHPPVKYPSQIVCSLKNAKWFIQKDDNGKAYFVKPEDAIKSRIPKKYESLMLSKKLNLWLREMNFGVQEEIKNEQYEKENDIISSVVGLNDNSIGILRQFNNSDLSSEVKEEILNNINQYLQSCLSESMYRENDFDINRLNEKSEEAYNNANDMEYEDRKRSVRIIDPKKALAEPFLRQVCVNEDGDILCQVCRNRLPFKKPNGQEYFEKVQLFPKSLIKKELKENYIACCPLCSAKMKVFYSHNSEAQNSLFKQIAYSQESIVSFPVQLDKDSDITFSKRHIVALRKMIELSQKE